MGNAGWLTGVGRVVVGGGLLLAALALWFLSGSVMRMLATLAVPVFIGCDVAFMSGRGHRPLVVSGVILVAVCPLADRDHAIQSSRATEHRSAHHGSAGFATGLEPRWLVVW
jgi:hypothetical protein